LATATWVSLRDNAGLPKDLVLYLARHECGTKTCREKGIGYAGRLLGHADISTMQRYVHLDDREMADAQDLVEYEPARGSLHYGRRGVGTGGGADWDSFCHLSAVY